jgi:cathepsin L
MAIVCLAKPLHAPSTYLAESQYEMLFTKWMVQHGKNYEIEEFFGRYGIFKSNLNYIHNHNTFSNQSYTMGMNQFGDLTQEEFKEYVGLRPFPIESENATVFQVGTPSNLPKVDPTNRLHLTGPDSADWRLRPNAVTSVKNQGQCGSCYAFGAIATVEGWNGIHGGSGDLSEQQVVDCSISYGNSGCGSGYITKSLDYMQANGVAFLQNYPYVARQQNCLHFEAKVHPPSYRSIMYEAGIVDLVYSVGPTAVAIAADAKVFQFYHSGIINDPSCGTRLDHVVTVVGYTPASYIIKNSWAATWGNNGYVEIARNAYMCGIGSAMGGFASSFVG